MTPSHFSLFFFRPCWLFCLFIVHFTPLFNIDNDIVYTSFILHIMFSGYLSASSWKTEFPHYLLEDLGKSLNLQTWENFHFKQGGRAPRRETGLSLKLWDSFWTPSFALWVSRFTLAWWRWSFLWQWISAQQSPCFQRVTLLLKVPVTGQREHLDTWWKRL